MTGLFFSISKLLVGPFSCIQPKSCVLIYIYTLLQGVRGFLLRGLFVYWLLLLWCTVSFAHRIMWYYSVRP
jgi:hypothetical protein